MKFNALVVAAMVITSVNAVRYEGLPSGYDELPSEAEYSGGRSTTVVTEGSSGNGQNPPQESEAARKAQICADFKRRLGDLWDRSVDLEAGFHDQLPEYHNLMKGIGENGRMIKKSQLGPKQVAGYLALNGRNRTILTIFDHEYAGVVGDYGMAWGGFSQNECPTESFSLLSPEEMVGYGHFLQLPDADGVIASSEQ
ncbi:hypothetical protein BASA83_000964 [Batrachochytrium salamandrivorans]|nr:hypothetical protein BASA83_000964 [Batrachochytrium salamandrivorans]